jgi:cytochrome c oxidase subunit 2
VNKNKLLCYYADSPEYFKINFQDPATTTMEGLFLFNLHLLFIIISIILLVSWLIFLITKNFIETEFDSILPFTHSNILEIVWTSIPALVLLSLSSPSFSLLYSFDEISNPELTLKVLGHQWYWSYETSDFNSCSKDHQSIKFSSYIVTNDILKENINAGHFRILETDKRLVLPANTHYRLLITAVDVLHSWAVPSFGIKVDACPGRLNQANIFIKRCGLFFGQCSEICGVNHAFMPIVVLAISTVQFYNLLITDPNF